MSTVAVRDDMDTDTSSRAGQANPQTRSDLRAANGAGGGAAGGAADGMLAQPVELERAYFSPLSGVASRFPRLCRVVWRVFGAVSGPRRSGQSRQGAPAMHLPDGLREFTEKIYFLMIFQ